MSYFVTAETLAPGKIQTISGAEARHIAKSRRIAVEEIINLQDGDGNRFEAIVTKITPTTVTVRIMKAVSSPSESSLQMTLFQAAVKEKSLDNILQKTTELGVSNIFIWNAIHSPDKIDAKFRHKMLRWQKIIDEACKQSDRKRGPALTLLPDINAIAAEAANLDALIVLDYSGTASLKSIPSNIKKIGIVIGPEGGLHPDEIVALSKLTNTKVIKFGPRILRADTAAIAAIAVLQQQFGDLN